MFTAGKFENFTIYPCRVPLQKSIKYKGQATYLVVFPMCPDTDTATYLECRCFIACRHTKLAYYGKKGHFSSTMLNCPVSMKTRPVVLWT